MLTIRVEAASTIQVEEAAGLYGAVGWSAYTREEQSLMCLRGARFHRGTRDASRTTCLRAASLTRKLPGRVQTGPGTRIGFAVTERGERAAWTDQGAPPPEMT